MSIHFTCAQCHVLLHAPDHGAGQRMRCPACQTIANVPHASTVAVPSETPLQDAKQATPNEAVADMANALMEELENEMETRHLQHAKLAPKPSQRATPNQSEQTNTATDAESVSHTNSDTDNDASQSESHPMPKVTGRAHHDNAASPADTGSDSGVESIQILQDRPHHQHAVNPAPKLSFPTRLACDKARPYLVVTHVGPQGVALAFDSRWLKHERFRMSMPRMCVFTGETDPAALVARPVMFEQHLSPIGPGARNLAMQHEVKRVHQKTDRKVLVRMGDLPDIKSPFNHTLPCYIASDQTQALIAQSESRSGGGATCHIRIPHAPTALAWLTRVNGACGQEHELLTQLVFGSDTAHAGDSTAGHIHAASTTNSTASHKPSRSRSSQHNPLAHLADDAKQALDSWCHLHAGEKVLAFFADADTPDQPGQAGLVVSNQRLIYKKYHHEGSAELSDANSTLICRPSDQGMQLVLVTSNTRHRLTAISPKAFQKLQHFLNKHSRIQIQLPNAPAEKQAV